MSLFSNESMGPSGGVIQTVECLPVSVAAASANQLVFICPVSQRWRLAEVRSIFGTQSTSGTVQVEVLTGTQAVGSGTNVTSAIALSGAANTVTVTNATSQLVLSPGDRIAIKFAGTMTGLANGLVQLTMHRTRY